MKNKVRKCKLCSEQTVFEEIASKSTRRFQCTNCKGYFVPFMMRHFSKAYSGYPKWISETDWQSRRFAEGLALAGATAEEIEEFMNK